MSFSIDWRRAMTCVSLDASLLNTPRIGRNGWSNDSPPSIDCRGMPRHALASTHERAAWSDPSGLTPRGRLPLNDRRHAPDGPCCRGGRRSRAGGLANAGAPRHRCRAARRTLGRRLHLCYTRESRVDVWPDEGFLRPELLLSLIHISEPTRLLSISYAVFC